MPSNRWSKRRGNWRRPAVCISKRRQLEEEGGYPALMDVNSLSVGPIFPPTSGWNFGTQLANVPSTNVYGGTAIDNNGRTINISALLGIQPASTTITFTVDLGGGNLLIATLTAPGWDQVLPFNSGDLTLSYNKTGYSGTARYGFATP